MGTNRSTGIGMGINARRMCTCTGIRICVGNHKHSTACHSKHGHRTTTWTEPQHDMHWHGRVAETSTGQWTHSGRFVCYFACCPLLPPHAISLVLQLFSDGYLTRAAVRSAIAVGGLQPYCLYYGNGSSQMKSWLQEQNVKIIRIKPRWISWLPTAIMSRLRGLSLSAVVRDFLVFDAPLADELTQYDYVLYSAAHVYFRSHIDWERFQYVPCTYVLPVPVSVRARVCQASYIELCPGRLTPRVRGCGLPPPPRGLRPTVSCERCQPQEP